MRHVWTSVMVMLLTAQFILAQNYDGDARKIGMGGTDGSQNLASKAMDEGRTDRSIVLPLGLIQVLRDRRYFDPRNDSFDPSILLEDLANPLHFTFGRSAKNSGFVRDIVNGTVNRDLGAYRGFSPASEISAQGLASPRFGHSFRVGGEESAHAVYLGAGPYLSMGTAFTIDERLSDVLSGQNNASPANATLSITNTTSGQGALSFTGGYRGRFRFSGQQAGSPQIHVAADYHYIHGLRYDSADIQVQMKTDSSGLLTSSAMAGAAVLNHLSSSSGRGYALDLAVGASASRWRVAVGANGIGNRVKWNELRSEKFTLDDILNGGKFVKQALPAGSPDVVVRLPVRYNGDVAYAFKRMSLSAEALRGSNGSTFHGGFEVRSRFVDVRGGGRYALNLWHPTAGVGLNFTRSLSLDVAAFQTTANIERSRKIAVAASIRISRKSKT